MGNSGEDYRARLNMGISNNFKQSLLKYLNDSGKNAGDYYEELHNNQEIRATVKLNDKIKHLEEILDTKDSIIKSQQATIENKDEIIANLSKKLNDYKYQLQLKTNPRSPEMIAKRMELLQE